jgi:chromodomain-helicase-DNA-binding protein 4
MLLLLLSSCTAQGLGKTVQAIAHLASVNERARAEGAPILPHMVVAPLSTLRNWEREFAAWAPHMNVVMMVGSMQGRQVIREHELFAPASAGGSKKGGGGRDAVQFHVLLTSYEMAIAESALLHALSWDVLCVDEGHRLRTKDSRLFQALTTARARQRTLLTGTPLQNRIEELFALLTYLDPAKFPDPEAYQARFAALDSETHLRELHALLAPHLLRRMKKDVLRDLPPKREVIVRVGLSPLQRELYKAVLTKNLPALRALSGRGAPPPKLMNIMMVRFLSHAILTWLHRV